MQKISLGFAILTSVLVIIFLVEPMAGSVYAQSTKPSAPKFTIQFPNDNTIQIVIENQAFTSSSSVNSLIYYNQVKDHHSDKWLIDKNYQLQSGSKTTTIEIDLVPFGYFAILNNSTILDFQVQAVTGYYLVTQKPGQMPDGLIPTNGYTEITFNDSETSDWSSTVTVDLKEKIVLSPSQISSLTTPSPDPTLTPTPTIPEFSWLIILPLFAFTLFVALKFNGKSRKSKRGQGSFLNMLLLKAGSKISYG